MSLKSWKDKLFNEKSEPSTTEDEYYTVSEREADEEACSTGSKMILLEPRAYSESQQIADHLKKRNSVVVNLKRVTSDQAKRIIDFLTGTIYAIGGDLQKIGQGIYLCTPRNVNVQGKITEEDKGNSKSTSDEIEF
ncbi:MAG: cell division protein SepF [Mollicutes bacterium]|jgi:cell division inhibitor SepF|nr:cell division protein SepF [Mollicutes bacterium]